MTASENRFMERSKRRRPVRVAIAGGGIGGMALALSLHDAGFKDVDVYESASSVKELGVGINVLPHATRELTELGLRAAREERDLLQQLDLGVAAKCHGRNPMDRPSCMNGEIDTTPGERGDRGAHRCRCAAAFGGRR